MTPKQKAKKLEAKSQYRHLNKKNKHRDRWGETQQSREEYLSRPRRRNNDAEDSLAYAYSGAIALNMLAQRMKRGKK